VSTSSSSWLALASGKNVSVVHSIISFRRCIHYLSILIGCFL
jgi:hypothetical protein